MLNTIKLLDFVHRPDFYKKSGRWTKSRSLTVMSVTHHRQNPLECINAQVCWHHDEVISVIQKFDIEADFVGLYFIMRLFVNIF
jgi:hypothetical protein